MTAGLIVSTSTPCSMADGIRRDAVSPDSRRGLLWQHESRCRHLITIVPLQQLSQSRFRVGNYSNGVGLEIEARARAHPDIPGISRRHTTTRSAWRSWSWLDRRPQPPLDDTQAKGEIKVGADEQHEQPRAPEDAARPFEEGIRLVNERVRGGCRSRQEQAERIHNCYPEPRQTLASA